MQQRIDEQIEENQQLRQKVDELTKKMYAIESTNASLHQDMILNQNQRNMNALGISSENEKILDSILQKTDREKSLEQTVSFCDNILDFCDA